MTISYFNLMTNFKERSCISFISNVACINKPFGSIYDLGYGGPQQKQHQIANDRMPTRI
ncbi:hypothetical protein XF_1857 [Xylella fastidiosa 9a5c]|uniref:Uncharacterized protein n=1 Tax=Xylella fastidiosa (strain 9a5c) TaxID=160492 RepID=Q9PCC4_XYLFA|nr:hypothetical protein XF_1857 [Xylella fastidiosa 9a5c]